jgi:hypothetical protein
MAHCDSRYSRRHCLYAVRRNPLRFVWRHASVCRSRVRLRLSGCFLGALPSEFLTGSSAASGIALITTFVNLGGFAGSYAVGFIRQRTESLSGAFAVAAVILFVFATLVRVLPETSRGLGGRFSRPSGDNSRHRCSSWKASTPPGRSSRHSDGKMARDRGYTSG